MYRELDGYPTTPDRDIRSTPTSLMSTSVSPLENNKSFKGIQAKRLSPEPEKGLKLPPIQAPTKSAPFPVTTASLIGWKSTQPENNLEIYGSCKAKGKIGILKIFNWPQQSL